MSLQALGVRNPGAQKCREWTGRGKKGSSGFCQRLGSQRICIESCSISAFYTNVAVVKFFNFISNKQWVTQFNKTHLIVKISIRRIFFFGGVDGGCLTKCFSESLTVV